MTAGVSMFAQFMSYFVINILGYQVHNTFKPYGSGFI